MSDGFLSRWTRRKQAVRAAERTVRPEAEDPAEAAGPRAMSEAAPEPIPDAAPDPAPHGAGESAEALPELPTLDALSAESDLAPFLRAGVPAALRNAALRRMWSLDPAIRDFVSEAREYAYDWNTPGGVPGLGPLLPSDDVQAMLRRIVGGPPGEGPAPGRPLAGTQEPGPQEPDAQEPDAHEPDAGAADGSAPDPVVAGSGGPDAPGSDELQARTLPALGPPTLPGPEPQTPAVPALSTGPHATVSRGAEALPAAATGTRPRLRRHGGAMPG